MCDVDTDHLTEILIEQTWLPNPFVQPSAVSIRLFHRKRSCWVLFLFSYFVNNEVRSCKINFLWSRFLFIVALLCGCKDKN